PPFTSTLLVQCYADLRHRLSFPTRRSSDLPGGTCRQPNGEGQHDDEANHNSATSAFGQCVRNPRHQPTPSLRRSANPLARSSSQDRKSTRLNSSHVKMSYAVFCWKITNDP